MNREKLEEILKKHELWLRGEGGEKANLMGADLTRANLTEADLTRADLRGAILPETVIQVGSIGSRKSYTVYWVNRDYVQCGCWNDGEGNHLEAFKKRVEAVYPTGQCHDEYMAVIAMFEKLKEMSEQKMEN